MTVDLYAPFPLDWSEFSRQFAEWRATHKAEMLPSSYRWPAPNVLADDVLWRGSIPPCALCARPGRQVELSAVTFPSLERDGATGVLSNDRVRYIGITFGTAAGTDVPDNGVVRTFAELEKELGLEMAS